MLHGALLASAPINRLLGPLLHTQRGVASTRCALEHLYSAAEYAEPAFPPLPVAANRYQDELPAEAPAAEVVRLARDGRSGEQHQSTALRVNQFGVPILI
eukprot:137427-Prymnesium_polylepis.1